MDKSFIFSGFDFLSEKWGVWIKFSQITLPTLKIHDKMFSSPPCSGVLLFLINWPKHKIIPNFFSELHSILFYGCTNNILQESTLLDTWVFIFSFFQHFILKINACNKYYVHLKILFCLPNTLFFFLLYSMVTQLQIQVYILFFSRYHAPPWNTIKKNKIMPFAAT